MVEGQKHTEEALAQKARLIDLSSDAILLRDASDRITFWNDGASAIYGYSRGQAFPARWVRALQRPSTMRYAS